jgi:HK97 family phage major capsid protein
MALNIDTLVRQRSDVITQAQTILERAQTAGRDATSEERSEFDGLMERADNLDGDIKRMRKIEAEALERGNHSERQTEQPDVNKDQGFRNFGEMLVAVARAGVGGEVDPRLLRAAASGLSEKVPSDGGFLVQSDFAAEILKRAYNNGQIASRVRRTPVGGNGLRMNGVDETSRATGSRHGGVRAYWQDEADAYTASAPKFRKIELTLKKLTGLYYATDELIEDATALESVAGEAFSDEIAWQVDNAILRGPGGGQPLGILNSASLVSVAKESGQAAATLVDDNIMKMYSRMWAPSRSNAVWLINQDIESQLFAMTTGDMPIFMPAGGLADAPLARLMGRPVIPVEQCSTLGTVGDIVFADLSQYQWIEKRGGIETASSIHVRFVQGEQTFRFTYRADGQPMWSNTLTPSNGSNTLSPFVALATRA